MCTCPERGSGVPGFAWGATTLLGSMYAGKRVLPPGIALKAHALCSSEAWGMIFWCQEPAYPGTEPEPFPAAQNKVSLTHTRRHLSVPVHKRSIIGRAHQICLWRRLSCRMALPCSISLALEREKREESHISLLPPNSALQGTRAWRGMGREPGHSSGSTGGLC